MLARLDRALAESDLDALVALSPVNVLLAAGTFFETQKLIPDRVALVAISPGREPCLVYCAMEAGHANTESWLADRRPYTEFEDDPYAVLAGVLEEVGASRGRVGIEADHIVFSHHERLRRAMPDAALVPADDVFRRLHAIKTPPEIEILARAALATDAAIRAALEAARPGWTERELGEAIVREGRSRGGEALLHLVVATGPNLDKAHAEPGDTPLEAGGMVRVDFGMTWEEHFLSDVARTAFVGRPSPGQTDRYRRLEEVQQLLFAAMRPGLRISELYLLCRRELGAREIDFTIPSLGHSIGLGLHEWPQITRFEQAELEPGMTLMIEPGWIGKGETYHTEDLVVITAKGSEVRSRSADWTSPLVIG